MENKKRGPGRPKGSKNKVKVATTPTLVPTTTPVVKTELEELTEWALQNRPLFFNAGKKTREQINKMYRLYNILTGLNQIPGKCGLCNGNIQLWLKKKLF